MGTGSIDFNNTQFDWQGGTIGGLTGGGFTIDANAQFDTSGAAIKTLGAIMTNVGDGTANFDGTGSLGILGGGDLINNASAVVPMELSLPAVTGGGTFTNNDTLKIGGATPVTFSCVLDNPASGTINYDITAGPLTLSNMGGGSSLDGNINVNDSSLTISGIYTAVAGGLNISKSRATTVTGTLTINANDAASIPNLILMVGTGPGGGGLINIAGELDLYGDMQWISGTIAGPGVLNVTPAATMSLSGKGTVGCNLDNEGKVEWLPGAMFGFASGTIVHNYAEGEFDFENFMGGFIPTFNNDGLLDIYAGDTLGVGTFTQSVYGTLQSDMTSDTSIGALAVAGAATLDGTLKANLENGYQPNSGTSYTVMTFASSSGRFGAVDPSNWSVGYGPTSVVLTSS